MSDTPAMLLRQQRTILEAMIESAAIGARGHCEVGALGGINASGEWFQDYSRLLAKAVAQQAAAVKLGGRGDLIAFEEWLKSRE